MKWCTLCVCVQEVSQLELEIHLEAFHSVDTRDLDWTKPLHREVGGEVPLLNNYVIDACIFDTAGPSVSHVKTAIFLWVWSGV